jgi:hypothetical protein
MHWVHQTRPSFLKGTDGRALASPMAGRSSDSPAAASSQGRVYLRRWPDNGYRDALVRRGPDELRRRTFCAVRLLV